MTCTAAASDSNRLLRSIPTSVAGLTDAPPQPPDERTRPEVGRGGDRVQRLCDVAQVGEPPLAVGAGEQAAGQPGVGGDRLEQRRHATLVQHDCPAPDGGAQLVEQCVGPRPAQLLDGAAEETRERRGPQPGQPGLFEGLQQCEPVGRDRGAEHARRARDHRGHAERRQRRAHRGACSLVRTSTATSPGRTGMPSIVAALPSSRATSAARSATTSSRAGRRSARLAAAGRQAPPGWRPAPAPGHRGRAGQPSSGPRRRDRVHDDPLVAERGATEHRLQRLEQGLVAAVVGRERGVVLGRRVASR